MSSVNTLLLFSLSLCVLWKLLLLFLSFELLILLSVFVLLSFSFSLSLFCFAALCCSFFNNNFDNILQHRGSISVWSKLNSNSVVEIDDKPRTLWNKFTNCKIDKKL